MHLRVDNEWTAYAEPLAGEVRAPSLTRGKPVQVFRLGPMFRRLGGEQIDDITDEMCADMVRVFDATRAVEDVPIDWAHNSAPDGPRDPEQSGSLGRVAALVHEPGKGLWAVPEYTERGAAVVDAAGGVLFTSPEFARAPIHSRTDGSAIGGAALIALALTNRPAQDRLERVTRHSESQDRPTDAVSPATPDRPADGRTHPEVIGMTEQVTPTPANPAGVVAGAVAAHAEVPAQAAEAPMDPAGQIAALKEENAKLRAEIESLKGGAMAENAAYREVVGKVTKLTEDLAKVQRQTADEKARADKAEKGRVIDGDERRGYFAPGRRAYMERLYDVDAAHTLYTEEIARLKQAPEVDVTEHGHADKVAAVAADPSARLQAAITKYVEDNHLDPRRSGEIAYQAVTKADPTLIQRNPRKAA